MNIIGVKSSPKPWNGSTFITELRPPGVLNQEQKYRSGLLIPIPQGYED